MVELIQSEAGFAVRVAQPFGYEVELDLSRPISPAQQDRLRTLLHDQGLLVFRDQRLDRDRQVEVMEGFGRVLRAPEGINLVSTDPETGWGGTSELKFHSDLAFSPYPCKVMSLYGLEVTDGETSTLFASGLLAWRQMPDVLRERFRGLKSRMELPRLYANPAAGGDAPAWLPWTEHPAVMPHPVTGQSVLFVNEMQTTRLVGVNEEESWALMQAAFGYLYEPSCVHEHVWNRGDLVIWDNIALQHARSVLSARSKRTLQRVIVADKRFSELYPDVPLEELGVR